MYLQELGSIVARVLINQSIRACDLGKLLLLGVSTIYLLQLLFDNFYKSAFCAFQALIIYVITCMYTEDQKFHLKFICQHSHRVLLSTWRIYKLVLFQQTDWRVNVDRLVDLLAVAVDQSWIKRAERIRLRRRLQKRKVNQRAEYHRPIVNPSIWRIRQNTIWRSE